MDTVGFSGKGDLDDSNVELLKAVKDSKQTLAEDVTNLVCVWRTATPTAFQNITKEIICSSWN
jgi:hypothetical protein